MTSLNQVGSDYQWKSFDLPGEVFNAGNGDIRQYDGHAVQVYNNGNGTRRLQDLGDWGTYQTQQQQKQMLADQEAKQKALLDQQKQERTQMFNDNKGILTGLVDEYGKAVPQIFDKAYQDFNIPGLLDATNGLKSRIDDLKGNLSGHGAGGYASANQVDQAVNSKYLPTYLSANDQLQRGVGLAQNEIDTNLKPYETKIDVMNQEIARQESGFDAGQQRELDALLAQLNAGVQLSGQQMSYLSTLATNESNYAATLQKIQSDQQIANQQNDTERYRIDNTYKALGKYGLINPVTGQTIGGGGTGSSSGGGTGNPWLDFLNTG